MKFSKKTAIEILNAGLTTGADYAEIYFQRNENFSYTRRYKKVYATSSTLLSGVGIRLLKGNQQVYGYTANLSKKNLLDLAKQLALGFTGEQELEVKDLKLKKYKNINVIKKPHNLLSTEEKISYLEKGEKVAFDYSPLVQDVISAIDEEDEHVEIYNSDGVMTFDDRVRTKVWIEVVCKQDEKYTNGFEESSFSKGLEILDETDFPALAIKAAKNAISALSAIDAPSGELPVVIGNGFGGVLFHEACGHPLEGSAICRNISPFSDKLGQKIGTDILNAFDDGTIPNGWGSENVDDEGIRPTKNQLIKDGVLVSYMLDRYTTRRVKLDGKITGSCRRESYMYSPTTRMTNTYIDNGKSNPEDIIASVKYGIYCKSFTGGQVDTSTDQFIFTSDEAYLIKDGKLDKRVKSISLIGYGYEILKKITMIGNDLKLTAGDCGASSGSLYVQVGQPTLLISSILVGGTGEE